MSRTIARGGVSSARRSFKPRVRIMVAVSPPGDDVAIHLPHELVGGNSHPYALPRDEWRVPAAAERAQVFQAPPPRPRSAAPRFICLSCLPSRHERRGILGHGGSRCATLRLVCLQTAVAPFALSPRPTSRQSLRSSRHTSHPCDVARVYETGGVSAVWSVSGESGRSRGNRARHRPPLPRRRPSAPSRQTAVSSERAADSGMSQRVTRSQLDSRRQRSCVARRRPQNPGFQRLYRRDVHPHPVSELAPHGASAQVVSGRGL
mmetsp:Transcript_63985/g.139228  ORF Transcript_63985/g.139228 Transcript_63985/m.139228 type:complete len:262 (-) Transcript_63985:1600-2385(-)